MSLEHYLNHTINITLPNGEVIWDKQLGVTKWHALDKSYTKYMHLQSDRTKYNVLKPLIRVR